MLILALDTTTRAGSCALWRDGVVLEARVGRADLTHAQRLPGDLADLLAAHGLTPAAIDRYAVAAGPGSFTGLRVGIATIQALALVHEKRVVPITALDALGQMGARMAAEAVGGAAGARGAIIGAWMDAYRGEVFGALFRVTEIAEHAAGAASRTPLTPSPLSPGRGRSLPHADSASSDADSAPSEAEGAAARLFVLEELSGASVGAPEAVIAGWAERLAVLGGEVGVLADPSANASGSTASSVVAAPFIVIGDGVPAAEARLRARWPEARLVPEVPLAAVIAELAGAAPPERAVHPHAIVPVYVRRSDAEILRERQLAPDLPGQPSPAPAGSSPAPASAAPANAPSRLTC